MIAVTKKFVKPITIPATIATPKLETSSGLYNLAAIDTISPLITTINTPKDNKTAGSDKNTTKGLIIVLTTESTNPYITTTLSLFWNDILSLPTKAAASHKPKLDTTHLTIKRDDFFLFIYYLLLYQMCRYRV